MDAKPPLRRGRQLLIVLAALLLVPGLLAGPAHATPAPVVPTPLAPLDQSAVLGQVTPGLVDINTTLNYQGAVGAGTGIVLDPNGEVLTNNHVIEGATEITATSLANGRTYPVDVIGYDRTNDIALIRLRGASDLPVSSLGTSSSISVGDPIAAIGNAGGTGGAPSFSPGTITQLGASVRASDESGGGSRDLTDLIRVAADVRPGDSGGPLVNATGQVIGVTVAATLTYRMGNVRGGEGFAIPIDRALGVAGAIRSGGGAGVHMGDTAFIGVGIADASDGGPAGAVVRQVLPDTPARGIGIMSGDVIVAVDGVTINTASDLSNVMDAHHPGDTIVLTWLDRAGNPQSAGVVLSAGPVG
ncbi:trypsin-like peptidase domain-containing protein [Mycobacterium sp. CVI_P3]|uniref:Trypsin-like peptidase domain-containing protein n=1 Tax=Mycobacterium pinniadriaticum TaxID=2994102 RepID=A0ABT3SAR9_9MYCO|nr:trypsin-like peptidase domain-containing protein [Mycobacterium pinniadriaticum]MCX2929586.1 trypsin-like peptidase domain-containing protein [Mycobacterium pinniadriaticum]MCX2936010.1 trypsin-like peptidase domain-containing protein [Mycobacterium pinniadriaticum]